MSEWGWQYNDDDFSLQWSPWHVDSARLLGRSYLSASLHSGLLLRGTKGLAKREFAKRFSGLLLCDQLAAQVENSNSGSMFEDNIEEYPSNLVTACGNCASCRLLKSSTHPDLYFVGLDEGKKSVAVDQIRELIEAMQKTPQVATNKVAIIDPADMMNESASNALLKVLEEPPDNTYFILIADHFERLLPTIRSRCFSQVFAIPEKTKSLDYLVEQGYDRKELELLWGKHRGFIQSIVNELEGHLADAGFKAPMLAFLQNRMSQKDMLDRVDKETLGSFVNECVNLFSQSNENELEGLSANQIQSLYWRSLQFEKDIAANPLAKLAVSDYLSDCRQLL